MAGQSVGFVLDGRVLDHVQTGAARGGRQRVGVERALVDDLTLAVLERDQLHDVAPAANSTTRQPPSDDLGQRGQIGRNAGQILDASRRPAEARHDLVEDEEDTVLVRKRA